MFAVRSKREESHRPVENDSINIMQFQTLSYTILPIWTFPSQLDGTVEKECPYIDMDHV